MTDTNTLDVGDAVNIALRGIRAQLTSAQELATGPARNVIANLLDEQGLLTVHFNSILEVANRDADEFNALALELEDRDTRINKLELRAASLVDQLRKAELTASEAEAAAAEARAGLRLTRARLEQEQQQHKALAQDSLRLARTLKDERAKKLDGERLKKQLKDKQAELAELRSATATLRGELARVRKDKARIATDLADAGEKNTQLHDQLQQLARRLAYTDGDTVNRYFEGDNGVLFYLYTFGFGLHCQEADRELINPGWHMELRTNIGHCVLVMIDDYLEPVIPPSAEMGIPPAEVVSLMRQMILERCRDSFPLLAARRAWAQEQSVDTLGLPAAALSKLKANGLATLFDLLIHPVRKLVLYPGIGQATAERAHNLAQAAARAWQKDYQHSQRKADQAA